MRHRAFVHCVALVLVVVCAATVPQARPARAAVASQQVPGNVVPDAGFEDQGTGWEGCGGIAFADRQAAPAPSDVPLRVRSGRYAAQLGSPTIDAGAGSCPTSGFNFSNRPYQVLRVPVNIPASAQVVTVSFWYSRIGPENSGNLSVFFSDDLDFITEVNGERLDNLSQDEGIGWHEFRQILRGEALAGARDTKTNPTGQTFLNIRLERSVKANQVFGVFVDDVAVTFSDRSLTPSPLPVGLAGNGTQPIVFLRASAGEPYALVHRMDTDGQRAQAIYRSRLLGVKQPRWSPGGQRLVVIEHDLQGADPLSSTDNAALVDELTVLDANGTPLSAPGRALGQAGVVGNPAGCAPGPGCSRPEQDALDGRIYTAEWAPGSNALVVEQGSYVRNSLGQRSDDITALLLVTGQTPFDLVYNDASRVVAANATQPSWGATNTILFRSTVDGIYADTPEIKTGNETLVVQNLGGLTGRRQDSAPAWSRDGTTFVTVRRVAGGATFYGNRAIMLHDAANPALARALVTVDYPSDIDGKPAWSPDGQYLLYTVRTPTGTSASFNIWWLELATGATGPLTTDGASIQPDWRAGCAGTACGVPAGRAPGGGSGVTVPQGLNVPPGAPPAHGGRKTYIPAAQRR